MSKTGMTMMAMLASAIGLSNQNAVEMTYRPRYDSGRRDDGIARIREFKRTTRKQHFVRGPRDEAVKVCKRRNSGIYAGLMRP